MDLGTAFDNCYRLVSYVDNTQREDNGQHPDIKDSGPSLSLRTDTSSSSSSSSEDSPSKDENAASTSIG